MSLLKLNHLNRTSKHLIRHQLTISSSISSINFVTFERCHTTTTQQHQTLLLQNKCSPPHHPCSYNHNLYLRSPLCIFKRNSSSNTSTNTATNNENLKPFVHPKAEEVYHKMIQLNRDEVALITDLINEKLGIKISEFERMGGALTQDPNSNNNNNEQEAAVEQKTQFELKLIGYDDKSKIKVIKEVRAMTGLGLKESKELVEGVPKVLKKDIKLDEAEELKKILEGVGATVEIV